MGENVDSRALNRLGEIKHLTAGQDEIGQPIQVWTSLAKVWANVKEQNGSEHIRGDRETSIVGTSIRIRWRTDVTASMRFHLGSKVYQINAVLPDEVSKNRVDLVCELINA